MISSSDSTLLWWSLNILTKERYLAILDVYGSLDDAAKHLGEELLKSLGCKQETITRCLIQIEEFDAASYRSMLEKKNVQLLTLDDPAYPSRLKEVGDPPVFLSYKGDLSLLDQPTVGLVGTRKISAYGKRVAELFVPAFVSSGMITVSGLAQGIDAAVAEETLSVSGKTVAVLGHGLGMMYPQSNAKLAERILEKGGLLISEFPLTMSPDKYTFPARNRIIAGLSLGTVVLEAPKESGAIITAELALEYGRDVFAVPGQIFDENYEGCHMLIAKAQAKLVTTPLEVMQELGVIASEAGAKIM